MRVGSANVLPAPILSKRNKSDSQKLDRIDAYFNVCTLWLDRRLSFWREMRRGESLWISLSYQNCCGA